MADILNTVGDISSLIAAYEANKAKGNLAQAGAQQNQANAAANIYRTQSAVALNGPTASAKSAALGDQMANVQPFSWTGGTSQVGNIPVPQSTGGLTPANFGPATRKAGSDLANLSANRVSDPSFNIPKPPTLDPLPQMSGLDSALSAGSLAGNLAKAAGGPGGDIGKLIQQIKDAFSKGPSVQGNQPNAGGAMGSGNPGQNEFTGWAGNEKDPATWLTSDPGVFYGDSGGGASPTDPSGGTGTGPGMQDFYDWLAQQGDANTGGSGQGNTGNWWDE